MFKASVVVLAAAVYLAVPCFSQEPLGDGTQFYHLDFVVKEVEAGKLINTRSYGMTISTDKNSPNSSIRAGAKVPLPAGSFTRDDKVETSFSYSDIGVNIDCRFAKVLDDRLAVHVVADVNDSALGKVANHPLYRNNKWSSMVVVHLRKPTTIFTSDDPSSKIQMQLELTASKLP